MKAGGKPRARGTKPDEPQTVDSLSCNTVGEDERGMAGGGGRGGAGEEGSRAPLDPSFAVDIGLLNRNMWLFIWLKTIGSYDSGAFSGALGTTNGLAEAWSLSSAQQGTLSASVFLGNIVGCPLAGQLFSKYSEKAVLNWSLILNTFFTLTFASFPEYHLALISRFFIGITLSFIVVYTPVWVDEFAPKEKQSVWMAAHNAGVPLGIMFGYILGAFFPAYTTISWEWAFYVKCVLMVPTIAYVTKVDYRSIDTRRGPSSGIGGRRGADAAVNGGGIGSAGGGNANGTTKLSLNGDAATAGGGGGGSPSTPVMPVTASGTGSIGVWGMLRAKLTQVWASCSPLLANPVYMCCVLSLCSLYFIATGLQNFVTQYLREEPFNSSMKTIMVGFSAAVVTSPVLGVIAGGVLLDRVGGYHGNLLRVSIFCLCWATGAVTFSIIAIFTTSTAAFLLIMSVVLFCGGALIPPGSGLTMASLPDHLRSMGAAFSQTMYNLLGNYAGPVVCGYVTEITGKLKYGIWTLLLTSIVGCIPFSFVLLVALRRRRTEEGHSAGGGGGGAVGHNTEAVIVMELDHNGAGDGGDKDGDGHRRPTDTAGAVELHHMGVEDERLHPDTSFSLEEHSHHVRGGNAMLNTLTDTNAEEYRPINMSIELLPSGPSPMAVLPEANTSGTSAGVGRSRSHPRSRNSPSVTPGVTPRVSAAPGFVLHRAVPIPAMTEVGPQSATEPSACATSGKNSSSLSSPAANAGAAAAAAAVMVSSRTPAGAPGQHQMALRAGTSPPVSGPLVTSTGGVVAVGTVSTATATGGLSVRLEGGGGDAGAAAAAAARPTFTPLQGSLGQSNVAHNHIRRQATSATTDSLVANYSIHSAEEAAGAAQASMTFAGTDMNSASLPSPAPGSRVHRGHPAPTPLPPHGALPDPLATSAELLRLETEAVRGAPLPNQHTFGMDLVRTWLVTQSRTSQQQQNPAGSFSAASGSLPVTSTTAAPTGTGAGVASLTMNTSVEPQRAGMDDMTRGAASSRPPQS